ncbi:MAG: sigma-70 family RNA polymerase sigma factor [Planctomycetota bacterium]
MKQESSNQLVEHFFRHEYGNMVSVLTRAFGVSKIGLVEDMVSSAMIEAMNSWKQNGYPENPSGWIHRVARNRILDHLRREKAHQKAIAFVGTQHPSEVDASEGLIEGWFAEDAIADSLLRMMLICCHPAVDQKTQIALTLKILCGFSISEISRGLLLSQEAVKKRIQRGKKQLAELNPFFEFPTPCLVSIANIIAV